jgi:predicted DNA-binding protein (MmcQ/YjbR family)
MKNSPAQAAAAELRAYALTFPESTEEFPWGESAFKVKGKVFVFMYAHAAGLNVSLKLPQSNATALDKPFAEPTGYGLGKSGWVTCKFEGSERIPIDVLKPWIAESWRAVAPKTLVKRIDGGSTGAPSGVDSTLRRKADKGSTGKAKARSLAGSSAKAGKAPKKGGRESGKSAKKAVRKSAGRARKRT